MAAVNAELSPRDLYISALVGAIEMIRTGSTSVLDMPRIDMARVCRRWQDGHHAGLCGYRPARRRCGQLSLMSISAASLPLELVPGLSDTLKPRRTAHIERCYRPPRCLASRPEGAAIYCNVTDDRPVVGCRAVRPNVLKASVDLARRRRPRTVQDLPIFSPASRR